jgi:hypothetical protein
MATVPLIQGQRVEVVEGKENRFDLELEVTGEKR